MDAKAFRLHRIALGLTQAQLGERIGLSRVMIGLMERGQRPIPPRTVAAMAAVQPRPLERSVQTYTPLTVKLEKAFLASGLNYRTDYIVDDVRVDFYLTDLNLVIYVDELKYSENKKNLKSVDMICINGKGALSAFITLIKHGGFYAKMNAGNDPYSISV